MSVSTLTANSRTWTDVLSPESIRRTICGETANACATLGSGLDAIILTGSMARNEASITTRHEMATVLGDAEFLLVFGKTNRVPSVHVTDKIAEVVENRLMRRNITCRIC